jgi:hypothetical protein
VERQHRRNQITNPLKALAAVTVLAIILVVAWQTIGTAARQAEVSQPEVEAQEVVATEVPAEALTEAPTRTPRPTLTPLPTRFQDMLRQITAPEEIAGVWGFDKGPVFKLYYQFNRDGTYSSSKSATRERLENSPAIIGEFWFEGSRLKLNIIDKNIGNACLGVVGVYEVHLLENGALRFDLIDDECTFRSRELSVNNFEPTEVTE